MCEFFSSADIEHQVSCVETPEQNGRVERKHQHILNIARCLKFQSGLPLVYWSDFILHYVYLINRMPTPILHNKTPYEVLHKKPPFLGHLKVFGCLCYANTLVHGRTKFAPRARQCVLLGIPSGLKGYKVLDKHTKQVFFSRNVSFYETILPFKSSDSTSSSPTSNTPDPVSAPSLNIPFSFTPAQTAPRSHSSTDDGGNPEQEISSTSRTTPSSEHYTFFDSDQQELYPQTDADPDPSTQDNRRPSRHIRLPTKYGDYELDSSLKFGAFGGTNSCTRYPICLNVDSLSKQDRCFALSVLNLVEPKSYYEAVKSYVWNRAMKDEMHALEENQTWDIVPLPPGVKEIGNKWVYKIKIHRDGSLERSKARLVAKGYTQVYGIDFLDTYSPVAKINTVKTFLAVASVKHWVLEQLDVSNDFLHGDLEEVVYMKLPLGLEVPSGSGQKMTCRLKKSLYGLKQASRQWFAKLTSFLLKFGFSQSASDYSLFTKWTHGKITVLLVYVDDIIVGGDSRKDIEQVKTALSKEFKIKLLGPLKYFLGLEVNRNENGLDVCQRKYCIDLLKDTGYLESKGCKTPIDTKVKLTSQGTLLENAESYRRLVGRLHYLTITRPDIAFAVQQLCQYQKSPCSEHIEAACRVLRYLKSSPDQGIHFGNQAELKLTEYSDSDWASCPDTRRSITGYCTMLGSSLITWKTKKQTTVSRSSSEAEYRALAHLVCEVEWLKRLLTELTVEVPLPITVYCDNRSAIHIAENPIFHERTKHIEIDIHVTRERIKTGLIVLKYINTAEQLADIFTKGLDRFRLRELLVKLGIKLIPPT
ncbi:unnamed protein product [Linum trigynum]|uniref:Integrase catalytic domain-containing protein n=1 Tax=Linum trigynum TaxID=586398 RepID=A0AAV2FT60_9ROSI